MGDARQTRASICRGAAARRLVSCTAHYLPFGIHASAEKLCSQRQHHLSRSKPNRAAESIFVCREGAIERETIVTRCRRGGYMRGEERRAGGEGCVAPATTLLLLPLMAGLRQVLLRAFDTIHA
jgi:hypothetical protein